MFSYYPRRSGIHAADPLVKLFWFLVIFVGVFVSRYPHQVVLYFGSTMAAALLARMKLMELARTWGVFLFIFMFVYPLFMILVGWEMGLVRILQESVMMTGRVLAAMTAVSVLTATTTPNGLSTAFARVGMPFKVALVLELSFALIPEFVREFKTVVQMQQTRGYKPRFSLFRPVKSVRATLPVLAPMIFLLLHRAWDLAISLETRGFFFKGRPSGIPFRIGRHDILLVLMALGLVAFSIFYEPPFP